MKNTRTSFLVAVTALFIFTTACVKKTDPNVSSAPQDTVKKFVELSAGVKDESDRQKLLELCQGEMRRAFERMSPEAFKVAYLAGGVKLKAVKVVETSINDKTAKVSYEVFLENPSGSDRTDEINRREVELVLVGNSWLIENIKPQGSDQIAFTRGMIF